MNVCDNCNNMPEGMSGKSLYCWMLHLFNEEVIPLPLFSLPPLLNQSESLLEISRLLGQEILCRFAKTWNGCSVRAFRTFRHALRTIGGFSANRKWDSRPHFRKRYNYRECDTSVGVFNDEGCCWLFHHWLLCSITSPVLPSGSVGIFWNQTFARCLLIIPVFLM